MSAPAVDAGGDFGDYAALDRSIIMAAAALIMGGRRSRCKAAIGRSATRSRTLAEYVRWEGGLTMTIIGPPSAMSSSTSRNASRALAGLKSDRSGDHRTAACVEPAASLGEGSVEPGELGGVGHDEWRRGSQSGGVADRSPTRPSIMSEVRRYPAPASAVQGHVPSSCNVSSFCTLPFFDDRNCRGWCITGKRRNLMTSVSGVSASRRRIACWMMPCFGVCLRADLVLLVGNAKEAGRRDAPGSRPVPLHAPGILAAIA